MFKSLSSTSVEYEVVFAGNSCLKPDYYYDSTRKLRHFTTKNIKPAQCYEIARRASNGEVVVWIADDCEFPNDVIGKAYKYWKSQENEKLILSLQTKETGYGCKDGKLYKMQEHTFYSLMPETPLMAPIGMMSRKWLDELGGLDRRYVSGQYENDLVMRAYQNGGKVEIFGGEDCYVDIDHLGKSIAIGESTSEEDFIDRPFAKGYSKDREILETSWTTFDEKEAFMRLDRGERPFSLRKVSPVQLDQFEPYSEPMSMWISESNKDNWQ